MNIAVSSQLENYIESLIRSGSYKNEKEIVETAFQLFREFEARRVALKDENLTLEQQRKKAWMIQKLEESEKDIEEGRVHDMTPELFEDIKKRGRERRQLKVNAQK